MNIAIITGASSGLGREFALQICQNYASEIDEIWLLARRKEPLLALAQEISATGICVGAAMPMDITDDEQMKDFRINWILKLLLSNIWSTLPVLLKLAIHLRCSRKN